MKRWQIFECGESQKGKENEIIKEKENEEGKESIRSGYKGIKREVRRTTQQ